MPPNKNCGGLCEPTCSFWHIWTTEIQTVTSRLHTSLRDVLSKAQKAASDEKLLPTKIVLFRCCELFDFFLLSFFSNLRSKSLVLKIILHKSNGCNKAVTRQANSTERAQSSHKLVKLRSLTSSRQRHLPRSLDGDDALTANTPMTNLPRRCTRFGVRLLRVLTLHL